jgi:undecaprenyl pyrophosphate phosphatase UppP
LRAHTYKPFAVYRIVLAVIVIAVAVARL